MKRVEGMRVSERYMLNWRIDVAIRNIEPLLLLLCVCDRKRPRIC